MKVTLLTAIVSILTIAISATAYVGEVTMADLVLEKRLESGKEGDSYASAAIAVYGNTAVVGSTDGASVYRRTAGVWSSEATLIPSDPHANCGTYRNLAIHQNTIFVACRSADVNGQNAQGAVYVYERSASGTWVEQQMITSSDGQAGDLFGTMDVDGDRLAVGAAAHDTQFPDAGAIYIFEKGQNGWTQSAELIPSDPSAMRAFGVRLSLDHDTVVGVRPFSFVNGSVQLPRMYVFEKTPTGWEQGFDITVCEPSHPAGCNFGSAVAVNGDLIAIGNAYFDSIADGIVYVLSRSGSSWTQIARITAPDPIPQSQFGSAIEITDTSLIVSAPGDVAGTYDPIAGKAYVFSRNGSTLKQTLSAPNTKSDSPNRFGNAIWYGGNTLIIASPLANGSPPYIGAAYIYSSPIARPVRFDYDGDDRSDESVFRSSNGTWYLNRSQAGFTGYQFGTAGDAIAPADFTGDGKTDVAVFRPSSGTWFIMRSEDNTFYGTQFGSNGDIPAPGDYDLDGKADTVVFRPSTGTWFIQGSTAGFSAVSFGINGDVPTVGDFDGDGKNDVAVFRGSNGTWYRLNSSNGAFSGTQFGQNGDKVVPADFTGDGKTDIAVWRPASGTWFILKSEDATFYGTQFGATGDLPSPGDYDGDGKADTSVFRPSNGTWFEQRSTSGFTALQFGVSGDKPGSNAFAY